jgi:DNA polymerase-3 subunit alpha
MEEQDKVNEVLLRWAKEYNVKVICTNDSHYVDQKDYNAHDILLCINTGEKQATPAIREFVEEGTVMKGGRFAFWNDQFYFKTQAEMGKLFQDVPFALDNTMEIVDKCEHLKLKKDILLPNFVIPQEFNTQDDYLRHITSRAPANATKTSPRKSKSASISSCTPSKRWVLPATSSSCPTLSKPGATSACSSAPAAARQPVQAVAYCIGITNIDPIKYQLLFERFLNPDRKSMPDIDTDFDDEGRQKVLDYVVEKYGKQQVAQIVTYGTMAAKMSIKDVPACWTCRSTSPTPWPNSCPTNPAFPSNACSPPHRRRRIACVRKGRPHVGRYRKRQKTARIPRRHRHTGKSGVDAKP